MTHEMLAYLLAPIVLPAITEGQWYVDLIAIAGAVTAVGVIWRMVVWPGMKSLWAAILAAPKIAEGVGEVVHLIESDVLGKLEEIKIEAALHETQAQSRESRLDLHTTALEDHELRLGKIEQQLREYPNNEGGDYR